MPTPNAEDIDVRAALSLLQRMQGAAPPAVAARLAAIHGLIQRLESEAGSPPAARREPVTAQPITIPPQVLPADAALIDKTLDVLIPLVAGMRGQVEALGDGRLGKLTAEQLGVIGWLRDHLGAAASLVGSLEQLASLRAGTFAVDLMSVSPLDLLAAAWHARSTAAAERDLTITIRADDPIASVRADYTIIIGVLCDLIDNALAYTPYGGSVRVTAQDMGDQVLFSVADSGIGISEDDLRQIGRPFWRALYQPLVRQQVGAGLRLYVARLLLALHDGDLIFSGEPGLGSTFSFTLPADREAQRPDFVPPSA